MSGGLSGGGTNCRVVRAAGRTGWSGERPLSMIGELIEQVYFLLGLPGRICRDGLVRVAWVSGVFFFRTAGCRR